MAQPIIRNPADRAAVTEWIDREIGELHEERAAELSRFKHDLLSKHIDTLLKMRLALCGNPKSPFVQ